MEPDQIDMMNEKELRVGLRKLVKENVALRAKIKASNSDYAKCAKKGMNTKKCHAYNGGECMNAFTCS